MKDVRKEIEQLVGKKVTVAVSTQGIVRNGFHTQMSIEGTLEENDGMYRVLRDNCTFTYFTPKDVYLVNPIVSTGVVIHIIIDTPKEE